MTGEDTPAFALDMAWSRLVKRECREVTCHGTVDGPPILRLCRRWGFITVEYVPDGDRNKCNCLRLIDDNTVRFDFQGWGTVRGDIGVVYVPPVIKVDGVVEYDFSPAEPEITAFRAFTEALGLLHNGHHGFTCNAHLTEGRYTVKPIGDFYKIMFMNADGQFVFQDFDAFEDDGGTFVFTRHDAVGSVTAMFEWPVPRTIEFEGMRFYTEGRPDDYKMFMRRMEKA